MRKRNRAATAKFTTKGQLVIPSWLRREFQIENGTRVIVSATADGILLKPITAATIRQARGVLARRADQRLKAVA